jgi:hypothetical protein
MSETDNLTNIRQNKGMIDSIKNIDSKLESIIYYKAQYDNPDKTVNGSTVNDPPFYSNRCMTEIEDNYMIYFLSTHPSIQEAVKLVNEGKYYGEKMNEMKHGRGIYLYEDEVEDENKNKKTKELRRYEGYWKKNEKHGEGILYYFDLQGKQRERYKGTFKNGKRHGQGTLIFNYGLSKFKGIWKNDEKYHGTLTTQSVTYVGYFQNDEYNGYGTITYNEGTKETYTGYFKNGKRHGFGETKNNDFSYKGEWQDDKQNGRGYLSKIVVIGKQETNKEEREEYNGDFVEGMYNGNGILIRRTLLQILTRYQGGFIKGNKHGEGVEYDINERKKTMEKWENGKRTELKETESFSVELESFIPVVNNLSMPLRLTLWITSLVFTFLFFLVGLINIGKLSSWRYFATIVVFHPTKAYPLTMHHALCYIVLIIIVLAMLGVLLVLLLSTKFLKTGVEPLLNLFEYPTILFLIPLGLAVPYPFIALGEHVVTRIVMCIICFLISLISIILIFVILFKGRLTLFTFYDWIIKRLFLSTLMFLHYYVFIGSIAGLVLINWDPFDDATTYRLEYMGKAEKTQIVLCLFFLGGECTWTFMMKDCVMGAYGFLFSMGLIIYGAKINASKVFIDASLAYGSIGFIANIVLVGLGFLLYGKEMAYPSYDGLID